MRKVLLSIALVAGVVWLPSTASADPTTTGTWTQYPESSTEYQAQVQQPINTANTSNWSAKSKGGIPVMYQLYSRTSPAVFQSNYTTSDTADDFAFISFTPDPDITFNEIYELSAVYLFSVGDCHGGSIRWSVGIDSDSDGWTDGSVHIYYGDHPSFSDCTTNDQSGVNLIGDPDLRYDLTQVGGTFYDSYLNAQTLVGGDNVTFAALIVDGGWAGDQVLTVTDVTVNDNVTDFDTGGGGGDFTRTCDLPDAYIEIDKVSPTVNGAINEAPVQSSLADNGNMFRVVDCMYQYVLSIPSLDGAGRYNVELLIGGTPVTTTPSDDVRFDLK